MDPTKQRQAEIEARRVQIVREYPVLWKVLIQQWLKHPAEHWVGLTYSANYLFRTRGIRWAIDPFTLHARLPNALPVNSAQDLQGMSFILLTHRHADHLDREILRTLRELPIQWVVPGA
jgi:hypothetical protein